MNSLHAPCLSPPLLLKLPVFALLILLIIAVPAQAEPANGPDNDVAIITHRVCAALLPTGLEDRRTLELSAAQASRTLGENGSWPDIDYQDTARSAWKTADHLARLELMVKAYSTEGQDLWHDPALKSHILLALSFWLDNDFQNTNWWWNEIGVPKQMAEVLLLMKPDLTPEQKSKGIVLLKRSKLGMTGANLVWVAVNQIERGCLEERADVIQEAFTRIYAELRVVSPGEEGIQRDYSFHQHGRQLYSGGYGGSFAADCARFITFAWGTRFQIPPPSLQVFVQFLLEGQQWIMRGGRFDYSTIGREITRKSVSAARRPQGAANGKAAMPKSLLGLLASLPIPRQHEMLAYAQRTSEATDAPPLIGNRSFWDSDYMTHQRLGYLATVKLCSNRMYNGEVVNGEGLRSQNLSYGATFLYQTGREYENIFPVWDWRRIPGTTCEQSPSPLEPNQVHVLGKTSFVGSASDGLYGLGVQDLAQGHVTGRKAWFFLEEGFLCLGAGLNCSTANPLLTSINQCLLHGEVRVAGQSGALSPGEHDIAATHWVWHDGVGYVFPGGVTTHVANQPQTGRWSDFGTGSDAPMTQKVFSLWLDHGTNSANGTYVYGVLPDCSVRDLPQKENFAKVVQNTPGLQAITDRSHRLLEAAFWEAGELKSSPGGWNVAVDQPCLLLLQRRGKGNLRLTVSNPENKPLTVQVSIPGSVRGKGCVAQPGKTVVTMELPVGADAGKSLIRDLRE